MLSTIIQYVIYNIPNLQSRNEKNHRSKGPFPADSKGNVEIPRIYKRKETDYLR